MRAILTMGLAGLCLSACGVASNSSVGKAENPAAAANEVFEGPVPRATCGPGSYPETDMARIIDISDEAHPFVVSKLKDEIDMEDAGAIRAVDLGGSGFTYQGHYCGVPQREEPGVVACSYFWQGIRVFDIRDPYHPKTSSAIRFIKERGEIWFTNQNTGFHIAKFTNGVWPFKDLTTFSASCDRASAISSYKSMRYRLQPQRHELNLLSYQR